MGSAAVDKPHVLCVPFPTQSHITTMLMLSKLLHFKGFRITFVNTEYNHRRWLKSGGPNALDGLPDFKFETIPDGLPPSEAADSTQDVPSLCESISKNCLAPFRHLLSKLNSSVPVTFIVSDGCMTFTIDAAQEFGIPDVLFWPPSSCGILGFAHFRTLIDRGFTPLKDASDLTNGYLETAIDWIPSMKNIRLRDLPSFIRTTDRNDVLLHFLTRETERTRRASAVILNTFESFEQDALNDLSAIFPPIFTIGPLNFLLDNHLPPDHNLRNMGSSLWKEELECIQWLHSKEPGSVVYVNFGSITVITPEQMVEFAWGLANSKKSFLWIIRPDLVMGKSAMLPAEFVTESKDRGMLASWCAQEKVLKHPAIGGFLSHMGWNSTLESMCGGVPMLCWPFFGDQQTTCWFACNKWGVGMEIDNNVKRDEVERLVTELMDGEKGKEMKSKAMEWKRKAEEATREGGSSYNNFDALCNKYHIKQAS